MSTAILELPQDFDLQEGESFAMEIEGVAHLGRLVVQKVNVRQAPKSKGESVADFLSFCQALAKERNLSPAPTDEQIDEIRWQHLKDKHLK